MSGDLHNDLHQIELTAHALLSASLDNLNENFELLNQSQLILLTRLKIIEERLSNFKSIINDNTINEKELEEQFNKIKQLRKRLDRCLKMTESIEMRVDKLEDQV